jgi:hypothetical protein
MDGARYFEDGRLTIFRRSGVYYARLRTSGLARYLWRSLKTTNEQTAIQLGRRLLFQIEHRIDEGLPPKSKSFAEVNPDRNEQSKPAKQTKLDQGLKIRIGLRRALRNRLNNCCGHLRLPRQRINTSTLAPDCFSHIAPLARSVSSELPPRDCRLTRKQFAG